METLPFKTFVGRWGAIGVVAEQGMTYRGHVHTYLMCAPCVQMTLHMRIADVARKNAPVRDGTA